MRIEVAKNNLLFLLTIHFICSEVTPAQFQVMFVLSNSNKTHTLSFNHKPNFFMTITLSYLKNKLGIF